MNKIILILVIVSVLGVTLAKPVIDPCYNPTSAECKAQQKEIENREKEFAEKFFKESKDIIENYKRTHSKLGPKELVKQFEQDKEFHKKIVDSFTKQSLEDNAHGLAQIVPAQRLVYELFKAIIGKDKAAEVVLFTQKLLVDFLGDSIDILSKDTGKINKETLPNVLTHLTAARQQAELFAKDTTGDLQKSLNSLADRIRKQDKLLSDLFDKKNN